MDTKLLKQKILDLAIRGKLIPQDPNDEPASILLEKIRKEKQELIKQGKIKKDKNESTIFVGDDKQHYEKFADGTIKNIENEIPFEIPDSWCWLNGYQLFLPMTHTKPIGEKFQYVDIDSINNKTHYIPDIKLVDTNKAPSRASRKISVGDTVFSMVRPYLENIALIDDRFKNAIASTGFFVCGTILIDKKYIYYLMISSYTIKGLNFFMKGDNSPSINADNIFRFLFPLPPLAEQQQIVKKIEELFAQVDKIEEEKQSLLKLLDKAKDKVLDLAMKGKLVKQDPNDEPASVLLQKIFEEKKKLAKEGKIKLSKDELLEPQISDDNDYYRDNLICAPMNLFCYFLNGYAFKSSEFCKNGIDVIRISDLNNGYVDNSESVKIKENKEFDQFVLKKGDLCIAMSGATTGKIGLYISDRKAYINQRVGIIRPYSDLLFLYEFRNLYFDYKRKEILSSAYGGAQPNISSKKILEMKVPLFSPKTQRKIIYKTNFILNNLNKIKDSL